MLKKASGVAGASLALILGFNASAQPFVTATRPGTEGARVKALTDYAWSAISLIDGQSQCSPWIIRHGVMGTAKHCFKLMGMNEAQAKASNLTVLFSKAGSLSRNAPADIVVRKEDIKDVIFDSGDNDIAYILYDPKKTAGHINIDHEISYEDPKPGTKLNMVGFPSGGLSEWNRITSQGCKSTGYTGRLDGPARTQKYEGVLHDTTCKGWFRISGGAVFGERRAEDQKVPVYGVVSHTFDESANGALDGRFVGRDSHGLYSTTNFSPFSLAKDLKEILKRTP